LKGKGVDVSEVFYLENLKGAKHFFKEPNNFYNLRRDFKAESLDFVYSCDINKTKFFKILLKEWFYAIKVNGKIIIRIKDNEILSFEKLVKTINLLIGEKGRIVLENVKEGIIIYQKLGPALEKDDSIDRWSFGIITNGSKEDALERQIESIIDLKIPFFEIIICGPYKPKKKYKKHVKVIPFNYRLAWITRKKNLICKKAKYENMSITHNRFNYDNNWYAGMKKYGNYFEVLTCRILSPSGRRAGDWITNGSDISNRWINEMGLLQYHDWDENLTINGSFHIFKKSAWKKVPWDEAFTYGQNEDDKLSYDFHKNGIVPRFNPYSTMHTFPEKYGNWNFTYTFNSQRLGKIPFKFSVKYFQRRIERFSRKHFKIGFVKKPDYETYTW